jgi:hypothetical protein
MRLGADRHVLSFALHHIVADGFSLGILLGDLERAYRAARAGGDAALPPAAFQYRDHVAREQALAASPHWDRNRAWWRNLLQGDLPALDLPMARPRPARRSERGGQVPFAVDADFARRLDALARRHGATPFMVLLAACAALFHRLSGAEDIILGSVSGNRDAPGLAEVVGCFVNPLPLRIRVRPHDGFAALLEDVRDLVLAALDHGAYPFDLLVRDLHAGGDPGRTPLFDVGLSWNELPHMQRRSFAECAIAPFATGAVAAKYDLLLIAGGGEAGIDGVLEYAADLFDPAAAAALAGQLAAVLEQAGADEEVAISDLALGGDAPAPPRAPLSIDLKL